MATPVFQPRIRLRPSSLLAAAQQYPGAVIKLTRAPPRVHGTTFFETNCCVALSHNWPTLICRCTTKHKAELLPLLWNYLDQLHPLSWQTGKAFPSSKHWAVSAISTNSNYVCSELITLTSCLKNKWNRPNLHLLWVLYFAQVRSQ